MRFLSAMFTSFAAKGPRLHTSLATVVETYDGFILDQFGVLHNGVEALPGAVQAVEELFLAGKKLVILSNTSAPAEKALERLPKYGFQRHWFQGAVTSGEEASRFLKGQPDPKRVIFFTWDDTIPNNPRLTADPQSFLDQCGNDVMVVDDIDDANWLVLHGSEIWKKGSNHESVSLDFVNNGSLSPVVDSLLLKCSERELPMVCANPDHIVVTPTGGNAFMPGRIAERYQELTGQQHHVFGKPHAQHFHACVECIGTTNKVIHVGDSLHHDIHGAVAAGIDSLFVSSGIHASTLGTSFDEMPSKTALDQLFENNSIVPTDVIPSFRF